MKARIERSALAEAAVWVAAAISRNPATPALAGMVLDASVESKSIRLTGYDQDALHETTIAADVESDGIAVASGRFLASILSALKGETVTLEHADSMLTLTAGRSTYRVRTIAHRDYPALPKFPTHVGTIDAGALASTLAIAEHALSKDPNLANLGAFNIVGTAGELAVTTTDRYRMAHVTSKWADASGADFESNVPGTALAAVKGLDGQVEIGCQDGTFGLADATRTIVTRTLGSEHKYPRTAPIFAKEPVVHTEVDRAPLVEALKRAMIVADDMDLVVVEFSDSLIRLSVDGKESEGTEEVDTEPGFGDGEVALKFNAAFIVAALQAAPSERVRLGVIDSRSQLSIEPLIGSARFIVMPRRSE